MTGTPFREPYHLDPPRVREPYHLDDDPLPDEDEDE